MVLGQEALGKRDSFGRGACGQADRLGSSETRQSGLCPPHSSGLIERPVAAPARGRLPQYCGAICTGFMCSTCGPSGRRLRGEASLLG